MGLAKKTSVCLWDQFSNKTTLPQYQGWSSDSGN